MKNTDNDSHKFTTFLNQHYTIENYFNKQTFMKMNRNNSLQPSLLNLNRQRYSIAVKDFPWAAF